MDEELKKMNITGSIVLQLLKYLASATTIIQNSTMNSKPFEKRFKIQKA